MTKKTKSTKGLKKVRQYIITDHRSDNQYDCPSEGECIVDYNSKADHLLQDGLSYTSCEVSTRTFYVNKNEDTDSLIEAGQTLMSWVITCYKSNPESISNVLYKYFTDEDLIESFDEIVRYKYLIIDYTNCKIIDICNTEAEAYDKDTNFDIVELFVEYSSDLEKLNNKLFNLQIKEKYADNNNDDLDDYEGSTIEEKLKAKERKAFKDEIKFSLCRFLVYNI